MRIVVKLSRRSVGGAQKCGTPPPALVSLVQDTSRKSASELMTAAGYVDLLIPRGGAGLIRSCVENATVPCIETGPGICHVYVDKDADPDMALSIIDNAKTSRPGVCNAGEVCLVHRDLAGDFLPRLKDRLVDSRAVAGKQPVELRLDKTAAGIIPGGCTIAGIRALEQHAFRSAAMDNVNIQVSQFDCFKLLLTHTTILVQRGLRFDEKR